MKRTYSDQELVRRAKLGELADLNLDPTKLMAVDFSDHINQIVTQWSEHDQAFFHDHNVSVSTVGRLVAWRQRFGVIQHLGVKIQIYFSAQTLSSDSWTQLKKLVDLGDVLKVQGTLFVTNMGELTIRVSAWQIIAKALHPLPDKHHGLQDKELQVRKRFLHALVEPTIYQRFYQRGLILRLIRNFFDDRGYLEVETPYLQPILGGAAAKPFITHYNALKQDFYLRIAPELPLKQMVVAGFDKVYELGKCFRNEGIDATHNPEFTSLEVYTAYINMHQTMDLCEQLIHDVAQALNITNITWNHCQFDLSQKFHRVSMAELVAQKTGVNFMTEAVSLAEALNLAAQHQISLAAHEKTVGHIFNLLFEHLCEAELIAPTFVWGHHIDVSPLAKSLSDHPNFCARFELFIGKKEFANGFAELNDPIEQLHRFEKQVAEKVLGNSEASEVDYTYLEALEYGLVPTGGLGIGIDRLIMLLSGTNQIKDVIFFPHVKKLVE